MIRPGGLETDQLIETADSISAASVTRVEVLCALARLAKGGSVTRAAAATAIRGVEEDFISFWNIPITTAVVVRACTLGQQHGLRGYDAVQLGAAATWRTFIGAEVQFASFDRELWVAAQAEGFSVWPTDLSLFK